MNNFESVKVGDIVQNEVSGNAYLVVSECFCNGERSLVGQRIIHLLNPQEWKLVGQTVELFKSL